MWIARSSFTIRINKGSFQLILLNSKLELPKEIGFDQELPMILIDERIQVNKILLYGIEHL